MENEHLLVQALLRQDFPSFVAKAFATIDPGTVYRDNWHIRHIGHKLRQVERGECRRLVINIPPRHLKSICVTVAYSAWVLGHDPSRKVMCVSYSRELTRKHAMDFRTIIEAPWYRELFPAFRIQPGGRRDTEIITTARGGRFASSVGGSVLGRGADLIIVDDPIKGQDAFSEAERRRVKEFYDNVLYTRLNDKTRGAIIIVMQRLHEDDLVGHVLGKEEWDVVSIPAIEIEDKAYPLSDDPEDVYWRDRGELLQAEREPPEVLEYLRRTLGSLSFSAQYQQQPLPQEGNFIKREWIRYYDVVPSPLDLVVVSWDTASTLEESGDYSVGTVWGTRGNDIYLLEVIRGRFEVPDLRRLILETHRTWQTSATLIEDTGVGRAIGQELRRSQALRPLMHRPQYDKRARMLAQSPTFERGDVLLPREAQWLAPYLQELLAFPTARHDDQVDSTAQALEWLAARLAAGVPPRRPNPPRPRGAPRPRLASERPRRRRPLGELLQE
jgi:predicted phage terminase large subunit-like protein